MYAWIFRHLPGPLWFRITISALLVAGLLVMLFQVVFPWMSQFNPLTEESTLGAPERT